MAERRMFTKKVTDDDNFMSLSSSAQALYLHLSMSADDDGFCNQISIAMFKAHASIQDLQALLEKRYIYQFESGVIVIKHWRMANALRKDRYTETAFQEELSQLKLKENGSYTMISENEKMLPDDNGCRLVAKCLPQDSIGKDSIDKDNINIGAKKSKKKSDIDNFTDDEELKSLLFDFIKMRKDAKKPMTDRAVDMLLNKLREISTDVETQKKALKEAIFHGWMSVYPPKAEKSKESIYSSDASYDLDAYMKTAIGLRDYTPKHS